MALGVMHWILSDIIEQSLLEFVHASNPVVRVFCLGNLEIYAYTFASATHPNAVTAGYVRYKTYLYVEKPPKCSICVGLGHVARTFGLLSSCVGIGKQYEGKKRTPPVPLCLNYGKEHISISHRCHR